MQLGALTWVGDVDWPRVAYSNGQTVLHFEDDAVFVIDPSGRRAEYATSEHLDDDTFAHEVVDAVLPRMISMAGTPVLHGGSVAGESGAVVFVGPSGAGKSTLVTALAARGYRLIGDDAAVIVSIDGVEHVVPSGTSLRLYEYAASRALDAPVLGPPMAHWSTKRLVTPSDNNLAAATAPVPLRAVVELFEADVHPTLTPLDGGSTFELLARSSFDLPNPSETAGIDLLDRWIPLAATVRAYRLSRRLEFDDLPAVFETLVPLLGDS